VHESIAQDSKSVPDAWIISQRELGARWAYGELASDRFATAYPDDEASRIVRQKAAQRVPFHHLTLPEAELLASMLERSVRARPDGGLLVGLAKFENYRLESWSKDRVRTLRLVPGLDWLPLADWDRPLSDAEKGDLAWDDPRASAARVPRGTPFMQDEGIIVIPWRHEMLGPLQVLLEGTRRALLFLRDAPETARLLVWTPAG
jgi:hypothetical protein